MAGGDDDGDKARLVRDFLARLRAAQGQIHPAPGEERHVRVADAELVADTQRSHVVHGAGEAGWEGLVTERPVGPRSHSSRAFRRKARSGPTGRLPNEPWRAAGCGRAPRDDR